MPRSPVTRSTSDHDVPVFVDDSGRRARWVTLGGVLVAALCALWLAGVVGGMAGFSGFGGWPARAPHVLARSPIVRTTIAQGEVHELVAGRSPARRARAS